MFISRIICFRVGNGSLKVSTGSLHWGLNLAAGVRIAGFALGTMFPPTGCGWCFQIACGV